jgi:hypothetical protein
LGLLFNGVPVENGLVYWSNWAGLGDATQTIQVQKGLGASRVALNSVGGTINIITKTTEASKGGILRHSFTSYGNKKTSLSQSIGLTEKGFITGKNCMSVLILPDKIIPMTEVSFPDS